MVSTATPTSKTPASDNAPGRAGGRRERIRRAVRRACLLLAALGLTWAFALAVFGGVDLRVAGLSITTNDPVRPLVLATLTFGVYLIAGGYRTAHADARAIAGRVRAFWIVTAFAVVCGTAGLVYGTTVAAGSDSYGYVSQADLWLSGTLRVEQPWMAEVPWPSAREAFAPLGYRQVDAPDEPVMVPTYAPGLPLLMAAAKFLFGHAAVFWVVPVSAAVLVLATGGVAGRLGLRGGPVIAAWLMATSPVLLFMAVMPMADVPVTAAWLVSFCFLLGATLPQAALAGLAASVAILIRPNLVFVAAIYGGWYVLQWVSVGGDARRRTAVRAAVFAATTTPGALVVAAVNRHLYGSPFKSGYLGLDEMFATAHVLPNLVNYLRWLGESHTPIVFVGLLALALPVRALWPAPVDRRAVIIAAATVAGIWAMYSAYLIFGAWWFLRLLLPSIPFIVIGVAAVAVGVIRRAGRWGTVVVVPVVVAAGALQVWYADRQDVFSMWKPERCYVGVAREVARLTEERSVILSMQHSGSLRYYAGRLTMRYDFLEEDWLDRAVEWFAERQVNVYLVVEDWEFDDFVKRFAGQRVTDRLVERPRLVYHGTSRIRMFDLLRDHGPPRVVTESYRGLRSVPPAPAPHLVLRNTP